MKRAAAALLVLLAANVARAEPTTRECLDANERSIKLRDELHLLDAQRVLTACAAPSCPGEIRAECARRLQDVVAATPTLVFAVSAGGSDVADVHVRMDGKPLVDQVGPGATPVDPGQHEFVFTHTTFGSVTRSLLVREGEHDRRVSIEFGLPRHSIQRRDPTWRTAGLALASTGAASLIAGAIFGALAFNAYSAQQQDCSATSCPRPTKAQDDHSFAATSATISNIAFIAGGAVFVAGGVLFFAAPTIGGVTISARF